MLHIFPEKFKLSFKSYEKKGSVKMTYHTNQKKRQAIAEALCGFLADSTRLYSKTHICHWNIEGSNFHDRHILLEVIYQDLWTSLDEIAERMRALGAKVPISYDALAKWASLKDMTKELSADEMFKMLAADCHTLAGLATDVSDIAEKAGDRATTDLLTARTQLLEKHAWMLEASLR